MDQKRGEDRSLSLVADYNAPTVSEKVVRIIISYTDYVNRTVWHKRDVPVGAQGEVLTK
jgi:UDP-N-acetylglucosamine 2-epimerase (non-hydrolysing)